LLPFRHGPDKPGHDGVATIVLPARQFNAYVHPHGDAALVLAAPANTRR